MKTKSVARHLLRNVNQLNDEGRATPRKVQAQDARGEQEA
jgi:hypothetical protein